MAMDSSSVSAGIPPEAHPANVSVNPLQLLWLQESGIDRLWGRALTVSAPAEPARAAHTRHTHTADAAVAAESVHDHEGQRAAPSLPTSTAATGTPSPATKESVPDAATAARQDASPARQALAKLREQMQRPRRPAGRAGSDTRRVQDESTGTAALQKTAVPEQVPADVTPEPQTSRPTEPLTSGDAQQAWPALAETIRQCRRCGLSEHARQAVPGTGTATARLMIIDQAPGAQDEISGEPLSGQAGQLLDNMLAAIGLSRETTFITDVVKCRPMVSRPAEPQEIAACSDYLQQQIALVQPACLLLFGNAAQSVLGSTQSVGQLREAHDLQLTVRGRAIPVVVTFHPNHLMANQAAKPLAWADLKRLRKLLQQASA